MSKYDKFRSPLQIRADMYCLGTKRVKRFMLPSRQYTLKDRRQFAGRWSVPKYHHLAPSKVPQSQSAGQYSGLRRTSPLNPDLHLHTHTCQEHKTFFQINMLYIRTKVCMCIPLVYVHVITLSLGTFVLYIHVLCTTCHVCMCSTCMYVCIMQYV